MKYIPIAQPSLGKEELNAVLDCVKSTWISSTGSYIAKFEKAFAKYVDVSFATSCSNGTAALHLALLALGIGDADEVIVPNLTFVSTANVIKYVGARPIFVDVDPVTWNIDPNLIESHITSKTRAIIPVHLYGYPADMTPILQIAKKHHLFVIEDAAEAHGAKYYGQHVGTIGDIGCFSFYGNKIITTGEGGMIVTRKKKWLEKIQLLKNHGMSKQKKYYHPILGFNYRMTNLQAALGFTQLKKINQLLKKRQVLAQTYQKNLQMVPGISFQPNLPYIKNVCWLFSCLINPKYGHTRDALIAYLKKNYIDSRPFFLALTSFPMYKSTSKFPVTQTLSSQGISLPSSSNLTEQQIIYITRTIKSFARTI